MQKRKALAVKRLYLSTILALTLLLSTTALAATTMPHFALPSAVDGATIDSNNYQGRALLVNFFATWCPPCRREIPSFIEVQEKYADQGLTIIGISTDQGGSKMVANFIKKMKINYPVAMEDSQTQKNFQIFSGAVPTSFLINKQGIIVKRYDGYIDHDTLEHDVSSIIK
ncbi:MAG: TlpA family protein disulfide reductase [Desulfobulbaceae bacterium]|nr:TlpA family protein disulfide reductase [Desulfobulbaceae bacterium]HIJ78445.1 TlpA family protein disulfide reductase [Deltaproteobacteria bacterium]